MANNGRSSGQQAGNSNGQWHCRGSIDFGNAGCCEAPVLYSRKLTWKPKKGPIKTTVLLKGDYMGFHVSLGECIYRGKLKGPWILEVDFVGSRGDLGLKGFRV